MSFHDIRFPTAISFGSSGGPERRTEIVSLASGFEERNSPWLHSRRRFDAGYGVRSIADIEAVIAFFEARHGRLYGFRWRDPMDWNSAISGAQPTPTDQALGVGDGESATFQLVKRYASGLNTYDRPISKPDLTTLRIAIDTIETSDFLVDANGQVTFASPPVAGAVLTAGFAFDVPVRFDTDVLSINLAAFNAGEIPSIPIIEIRV